MTCPAWFERKSLRLFGVNALFCSLALLSSSIACVGQDGPLLFKRSTKVTSVSGWVSVQLYVAEYFWLNQKDILFFRSNEDNSRLILYRFDGSTRHERVLKRLGKLFNDGSAGFRDLSISPDGKWLLSGGWNGKEPIWQIISIDGVKRKSWPRRRVGKFISSVFNPELWSYAAWTPDSGQIVESEYDTDETVINSWLRPISSPNRERKLPPVVISAGTAAPGSIYWPPTPDSTGRRLTIANVAYTEMGALNNVQIISWRLGAADPQTHATMIRIPHEWKWCGFELSPDNRKIAFEMMTAAHYRVIGSGEDDKYPHTIGKLALWTCNIDGSGMREVGYIPVEPRRIRWQYEHFGGVSWLPDNRRLSFIYAGNLWTVPVN